MRIIAMLAFVFLSFGTAVASESTTCPSEPIVVDMVALGVTSYTGSDCDEIIYGTQNNDTIIAGGGDDTVYAGDGDDYVIGDNFYGGSYGNNYIDAGDGYNMTAITIDGNAYGNNTIIGGKDADLIYVSRVGDVYGFNTIKTGDGTNLAYMTRGGVNYGCSVMVGGNDNDQLVARGNDRVGASKASVDGGGGSDACWSNQLTKNCEWNP